MSNPIRLIDRLHELRHRRIELENRIRDEEAVPTPDGLRLKSLGRLKLRARDQINMICQQVAGDDTPTFPTAA